MAMKLQFTDIMSSPIIWRCIIFLVKFSHWSNFMPISWLVLELWQFSFRTDSREIHKSEIPTSEFYPISGDWGKLEILGKFGINVSNEMLLNATKCLGYRFYHFSLIKRKPTVGKKGYPHPIPSHPDCS